MTGPLSGKRGAHRPLNLLACALLAAAGCEKKPEAALPPEVQVITVEAQDIPLFSEWIGALDGYVNAGIRAQVSGYLLAQDYKEGTEVKKGDLLFQIDPRPFQAVLDQTRARLAQDRAQQGKTELDVKRYTPLAKEQALSQEELDNAVQANLAAAAQVQADEAAVATAQLNLEFTKITSPIDGLAGIALGQTGDLVSPTSGLLTTVSTIDSIKAYFSVSEQSFQSFWRAHLNPAAGEPSLELQLILSDGSVFPEKGTVFFADRQVNPNTGTLQIAGLFPNASRKLRPGQYGRVRAQTQVKHGAVLVPQRAVNELQGAFQLLVVDDQNKAHLKSVKVGEQTGPSWIIEDGLKSGERVVVEGMQKATNGAMVKPVAYQPPVKTPAP